MFIRIYDVIIIATYIFSRKLSIRYLKLLIKQVCTNKVIKNFNIFGFQNLRLIIEDLNLRALS